MIRAFTSCACILLTLYAPPAVAQKKKRVANSLTTVSVSPDRTPYSQVLIGGFGSAPVRHFLEQLSPHLAKYFDSLHIRSGYTYIGNREELADQHLQTALQKHRPDALLMFYEMPNQLDTLTPKYRHNSVFPPFMLITTARPNERYAPVGPVNMDKALQVVLWEPANNRVVWRGVLHVAGHPQKEKFFVQACKLVTDEFARHALMEGAPRPAGQ